MKKSNIANGIAYISLTLSLSFWLDLGLGYLHTVVHLNIPGLGWLAALPGWKWALFEAFSLLLLAIIATVIGLAVGAKLWRIALPVALLMFLLTLYIMGS